MGRKPVAQPQLGEPFGIRRTFTKRTILDTFGCAFGGYSAEPSRIARKLAGDVSAKDGATGSRPITLKKP